MVLELKPGTLHELAGCSVTGLHPALHVAFAMGSGFPFSTELMGSGGFWIPGSWSCGDHWKLEPWALILNLCLHLKSSMCN